MNTHWKGKSGCEHSINHYKNICKGASFSIHILEKLEGDGFINGQWDLAVQKLRLQGEDYWIKKLHTIYPYDLNKRAKNSNLEQPTGKLFPPFPKFSNRRENLEKKRVNKPSKFNTTDTLLVHIAIFPSKNRSDNFPRILEGLKRKDLIKLAWNPTDQLKTCHDTKKIWCKLIIDIFWLNYLQQTKRCRKSVLPLWFQCFSITKDSTT